MFKYLQKVGKSFMVPIAILPAAGLLLGIGGAFSSKATIAAYPILDVPMLQAVFNIMSAAGNVIFSNLALLLCVGLCVGLAKRDKGVAALAGVVGFLVMNGTIDAMLKIFNPDGNPIDTGVIGALVIGMIATTLHNKYQNIQLPQVLGFFSGSRFVPIITSLSAIFIGVIFYIIWPTLQNLLIYIGNVLISAGPIGTFFYGFLMRLCGAIGLHHMIYPMFWYTELGGTEIVNGVQVVGAQKIFFAQLADPNHVGLFTEGTRFFAGRFATMMFGLPAACLAMYHCVTSKNKKMYAGMFFGVAMTSFITGITEPIEFMFLFIAPALYVVHAFLDGISFCIADILNISIGNTFSGGLIDFVLFGVLQGNDKTNWILEIPVGIIWFILYYCVFRFAITKFNIMTPGRGDNDVEEEAKDDKEDNSNSKIHETALIILKALGGKENLEDVDACITRLRVSVKDSSKVDKETLKKVGATAVLDVKGGIQAIYGAKAILYKNEINAILGIKD
ncbi:PTS transporter subunit EIIC [uncultured Megamonas sp.]|uniref:PTS transporter subunit EIIC n=1 Tax=uncultured Megamonas sp. TaxID=286140 RepID=UPI0025F24901|nr:PTS transporter subunit EIIC [uncultured Megamonas sp.]